MTSRNTPDTPRDGITRNAFLGGRLNVYQPQKGYRAGVDPVLLAASVPALQGQSVLELGCGVGVAMLCLLSRVPGLDGAAVEIQQDYALLAERNFAENGLSCDVSVADIARLPDKIRQRQFDHVIMNPPYFDRQTTTSSPDVSRETAFGEGTPLAHWVETGGRRLRPGGVMSVIHRAERLPELLSLAHGNLGSIEVLPITGRQGRGAGRIILRARKSGKASFRLHAPLVLHEGQHHVDDKDSYTEEVRSVLREGAALQF